MRYRKEEGSSKEPSFKQPPDKKRLPKNLKVLGEKNVNKVVGNPRVHRAGKVTFQGNLSRIFFQL